MSRVIVSGALVVLLAGCAASQVPPPPPAPAPVLVDEEEIAEEPLVVAEPEIAVAERIRAPFAVQSSGRPAPRQPRVAVVLDTLTATAAPRRATPAPEPEAVAAEEETTGEAASAPVQPAEERTTRATTAPARPAPAEAPPRTAAAGLQPREHRVASGETFMSIARRYGVSYTALLNANPGLDPDRLRPNQVIRLPAGAAGAAPAAAGTTPPAPRPPTASRAARTHTVGQGETLWSIARRYGVSPEQLRTANRLPDDTIRIGQTLVIPNS